MILCLFVLLLCSPYATLAQTNSPDSSFQKQFSAFNASINNEFNTFIQHNDSVFLQFLSQSWKEFDAVPNKMPSPPKPAIPPVYAPVVKPSIPTVDSLPPALPAQPSVEPLPQQNPTPINDQLKPEIKIQPVDEPSTHVETEPLPIQSSISNVPPMGRFEFFGTNFNIPIAIQQLPVLSQVSKQSIEKYLLAAFASPTLNNTAATLKKEADECSLNDWGLANLCMKAARQIYPHPNDQIMFTWFALIRSGFNVKIGYNEQNVYLLIPSNQKLYEYSYAVNGIAYYLLNLGAGQPEPQHLRIHEADYPNTTAGLSFLITQTPGLKNLFIPKTIAYTPALQFSLNKNLIDFYSLYPQCELYVFFKAPLSANALTQLDTYFLKALQSKNDDDKVAFLLHFMHVAIPYKTDREQFGHEKYLFADETLFYPAADCEDRAILLAKLINRYTSCKVIALSYPTHVSLAVNLSSLPAGKYIAYKNLRYYHCDPTYIGASCGMPMPDFENVIPEIIDFNL